jgi:hypothetical protein
LAVEGGVSVVGYGEGEGFGGGGCGGLWFWFCDKSQEGKVRRRRARKLDIILCSGEQTVGAKRRWRTSVNSDD